MSRTSYNFSKKSGSGNEPATDFISVANITDQTQKDAVNILLQDLIDSGFYNKLLAVYPFVGGTAHAHKFNLLDPRDLNEAHRLLIPVNCTHTNTGMKVSTSAINTFLARNVMPDYDAHFSLYSRLPRNHSVFDFYGQVLQIAMSRNGATLSDNLNYNGAAGGGRINASIPDSKGFHLVSITPESLEEDPIRTEPKHAVFLDAEFRGASIGTTSGSHGGASIELNGKTPLADGKEYAFCSMGYGLQDSEVTILNNIVSNYQSLLNRNV